MTSLKPPDTWLQRLDPAWRRLLTQLVKPDDVIATASLAADDPERARLNSVTYPDVAALFALAYEPELRAAIAKVGVTGMRVFDAGCGPGIVARFLLEAGASEVVGMDLNPAMLSIAEAAPMTTPEGTRLSLMQGDLNDPLPFPDNHFDIIWTGSNWVPAAHPEFVRVVRPGGQIVYNIGGLVPGYTYAWDPAFDARVRSAWREGTAAKGYGRRGSGRAPMGAWWGPQRETNFFHGVRALGLQRLWTDNVERLNPVPAVTEAGLCQSFAIWQGGHLNGRLDAEDWEELVSLWDHRSSDYIFGVPDGHFITALTTACCVPSSSHA